jgi:hypothetical protein
MMAVEVNVTLAGCGRSPNGGGIGAYRVADVELACPDTEVEACVVRVFGPRASARVIPRTESR